MNPYDYVKKEPYQLYIDGVFVVPEDKVTFDIQNPVKNQIFAKAYKAGKPEVTRAVKAARKAFDEGPWGKMPPRERSKLLLKAGQILEQRKEEFSCIETLECGKSYAGARYFEAEMSVDAFEYYAGKARCLEGKAVPIDNNTVNLVQWYPHGVVGEILPWNGPLMMGCQKICAILAAGNTAIVKPSSWASLSMLLLAEVFDEAGFPSGVVNVLTGSGSVIGDMLVKSPDVDMVAMTGGTSTGKHIIEASKDTVKDVALELGGKSPNIIFDDVDIDDAVKWARWAFTQNSGQVCVSGTRLIVQRSIYEQFIEKLQSECEKLIPGDGFDPKTTLTSLIHRDHAQSVWEYIEKGKAEGARLVCGGEPYTDQKLTAGNFVPPTLFADVTPDMTIFKEEIFGPVLCITPFDSEAEAIALANSTEYGLAGGVFTKNMKRGLRVAQKIHSGQIYVNSYFSKAMIESPGTGWKQSGLGVAGIQKYMISKTIFIDTQEGSLPM
ncbi:aldehyde dehydrogenase family protein [Muricomes intestini]|jgi:acyl-CoA reductase-like NAD-dependent aldehyde dehydrogenase|uniref:Aldehyde dehydrogenase (NAD+)/betaine-aldehyde dehydrogenase n=1 Tax=Muricomes intestini TaxID=1796634 RepID=A0A4R3KGW9_9FIRM|nr:aldehyde dehydrogenase family protein [Muricomes intestini]TCS82269.1 aldehyde dehydrogenase (NAD+)/betaine-aldehyde dehydrogenase [Muricomes intestini]HAX53122.1 aldehyde dehydrogenase [Lachnospiraceae bacterium]